MINKNSGYSEFSMSNRAVAAYENGEKPLSKWTKSELVKAIKKERNDLNDQLLKSINLKNLKKLILEKTSYHHTSKYCNSTDFYSISAEKIAKLTNEDLEFYINLEKETKEEKVKIEKCLITIEYWKQTGRSRRSGHFETIEDYALLIDDRYAYSLRNGRKDIRGNHCWLKEKYKTAPKGTAKQFKLIEKTLPKSLKK